MKPLRYLIIFFLVGVLLSACASNSQGGNSIVNSPCQVPCWQGITPGVTKAENINAFLKTIPEIDGNKIERLPKWNKYDERYRFVFKDKKSNGEIYIVESLVDSIMINGDLNIPLEQLIKLYGEPGKLIVSSATIPGSFGGDSIVLEVNLVYPQNGMAFSFYNPNLDLISITPNNNMRRAIFSEPKSIVNIVSPNDQTLEELEQQGRAFDWKGYREIKYDPQK